MKKKLLICISIFLIFFIGLVLYNNDNYVVRIEKEISFESYPNILNAIDSDLPIIEIEKIISNNKTELYELQNPKSLYHADPIINAAFLDRKDIILILIKYGADPHLAVKSLGKEIGYDNKYINLIESCIASEK